MPHKNKDRRTYEKTKEQIDEENITNEADKQGQMQKLSEEFLCLTQTTPASRWMVPFHVQATAKTSPTAIVVDTPPSQEFGGRLTSHCYFRVQTSFIVDSPKFGPQLVLKMTPGRATSAGSNGPQA